MNDFVSLIWGIIGVLLLILAAAAAVTSVVVILHNRLSRKRAAIVVGEDPAMPAEARFVFGQFQSIRGTRYVLCPYGPPSDYKGSMFGGSDRAARNYLFVQLDDQTSHYLMPTHSQLVTSLEMLGMGERAGKSAPVQWLCCHIVDTDTNGDGRLTEEDGFSVAFANPDGTQLTPVLKGVSSVISYVRISGDSMLCVYEISGKSCMSEIDIAERRIVRTRELPTAPSSS